MINDELFLVCTNANDGCICITVDDELLLLGSKTVNSILVGNNA